MRARLSLSRTRCTSAGSDGGGGAAAAFSHSSVVPKIELASVVLVGAVEVLADRDGLRQGRRRVESPLIDRIGTIVLVAGVAKY